MVFLRPLEKYYFHILICEAVSFTFYKLSFKATATIQVSSMIHSARHIVTPVANIVFCCFVFLDLISGERRTDGRTDNMCENNDPYWPWLWVDRVDQNITLWFLATCPKWQCKRVVMLFSINVSTDARWRCCVLWSTRPTHNHGW